MEEWRSIEMKRCKRLRSRLVGAVVVLAVALTWPGSSEARTVRDHLGLDVDLPEKIERIAVVAPLPLASVVAVYQGGDVRNLVGIPPDLLNTARRSVLGKYTPGLLSVSSDFYKGGSLNIEELLNLKPDVVFYSGAVHTETYKKAGIPAVAFTHPNIGGSVSTLRTLEMWLDLMEQVLGGENKARGIVAYGREVEAEIARRVRDIPREKRARVLILSNYNDTAISVSGRKTFGEYWCDAVGAVNVGLDVGKKNVNMEQIYDWAPDKVFLTTFTALVPQNLYDNTAGPGHDWSHVPAVRNRDCHKFPLGMHRWWPPCTDTPLALWWFAKAVYPDLFEDIDIPLKVKEYYGRFYGMELTDGEVEKLLSPGAEMRRDFF